MEGEGQGQESVFHSVDKEEGNKVSKKAVILDISIAVTILLFY